MTLTLSGGVNEEMFNKIVDSLNRLEDNESLIIYFTTEGGSVDWMEAIIHLINENEKLIQLIAFGEINSAGFDIFFRTRCSRKILPETISICHFNGVKVHMIDKKTINKRNYGDSWITWSENFLKNCTKLCSQLGFTDREMRMMKNGEDIFFQTDRIIEFLNNSNIGKHNEYIH